jgi:pimeloyl-ACP methyl ester carboxylesterase
MLAVTPPSDYKLCMILGSQQRLETARGVVEYLDVGSGMPTLYFHGTGAGNDAAFLLDKTLVESGCRLIIPNRPGYYGTTLGDPGSADFCVDLAADLLAHLGIVRAAVIGTSGGGMPAARFARNYPHLTAALILQCAQSHRWDAGKWLPKGLEHTLFFFRHPIFRLLLQWENSRQAKLHQRRPMELMRDMSGRRYAEICEDQHAVQQIKTLGEMSLDCAAAPRGIANDWAILVGENSVARDTIDCPTLIIHDLADPLVPYIHAEWSQSCIANSTLLTVHGGGHLIWFGKDADRMHDERMATIEKALSV